MGRSERSERDSLPPSGGAPFRLLGRRWRGSTWQVRRALGGKLAHSLRELRPIAAAHPLGVPGLGCGPTPWGRAALGVVQPPGGGRSWVWSNPLGAPVLVPWPDRLGGVSAHLPGTVGEP